MHFGITGHSKFSPLNELVKQMIEYVQKKRKRKKFMFTLLWSFLALHISIHFPSELCGKCHPTRHTIWLGAERK